jgi:hypothetical protein
VPAQQGWRLDEEAAETLAEKDLRQTGQDRLGRQAAAPVAGPGVAGPPPLAQRDGLDREVCVIDRRAGSTEVRAMSSMNDIAG